MSHAAGCWCGKSTFIRERKRMEREGEREREGRREGGVWRS